MHDPLDISGLLGLAANRRNRATACKFVNNPGNLRLAAYFLGKRFDESPKVLNTFCELVERHIATEDQGQGCL